MKKLIMTVGVAVVVMANAQVQKKGNVEADKAKEVEMQRIFYERTGGIIKNMRDAKGRVAFLNFQNRVKESDMRSALDKMEQILHASFTVEKGQEIPTVATATECLRKSGANAVIFLVDDPDLPMSLIAPESKWAFVNIARLAEDNPLDILLAQRLRREMWRAMGNLLGASNSNYPECVMRPCFSARDIDALGCDVFTPDPKFRVEDHLQRIGIRPITLITYRGACEQGWAPAPTNDIQRAIWEKAHEIPSKPIKIEYNEKRDKGK